MYNGLVQSSRNPLVRTITRLAGRLRFPYLFLVTAALFLVDILIPDLLPFADEILLGLGTLVFGTWRRSRSNPGEKRKETETRSPAVRS
jgi:hypothetical protein